MRFFRPDIFQHRKGVHIKLEKTVHAELRAQLFKYDISMQDIFDEFSKLIVSEDPLARAIVEKFVTARIKEQMAGTYVKDSVKSRRQRQIDELDHETLYGLIEEGNVQRETD